VTGPATGKKIGRSEYIEAGTVGKPWFRKWREERGARDRAWRPYVSVKVVSLAGRYWVSAGRYCRQRADTCCERILQTAEFKAGKYWMSFVRS